MCSLLIKRASSEQLHFLAFALFRMYGWAQAITIISLYFLPLVTFFFISLNVSLITKFYKANVILMFLAIIDKDLIHLSFLSLLLHLPVILMFSPIYLPSSFYLRLLLARVPVISMSSVSQPLLSSSHWLLSNATQCKPFSFSLKFFTRLP